MSTRVSVCIPTYNGEKYIHQQLESILNQLADSDEVIISDDSSTDNTLDIIKTFNDNRIRIFPDNKFKSPIRNLENALKKASGEFIFLSDQDDVWLPDKLDTMLKSLEKTDLVISDCLVTDASLQTINDSFFILNKGKLNNRKYNKWSNLFLRNPYLGCCMAFRHKILEKVLPFPPKCPMHDIWIGNVAAFYYHITFINEKLIRYRRHGNNASVTTEKSPYSLLHKLQDRMIIIKGLVNR